MIKKLSLSVLFSFSVLNGSDVLQDQMILKLLKSTEASEIQIQELRTRLYSAEVTISTLENKINLIENPPLNLLSNKSTIKEGNTTEEIEKNILLSGDIDNSISKAAQTYIVKSWSLNIRKEPKVESKKIGYLKIGTNVEVISIDNGWAKINKGYVNVGYMSKVSKSSFIDAYVKNTKAYTRAYPAKKEKVLRVLNKRRLLKLSVYVFNRSWYKIQGKSEFIHSSDIGIVFR